MCLYTMRALIPTETASADASLCTYVSLRSNEVSMVSQIGAVLDDINVKAFLRCYNNEGKLRAVVMQSGSIISLDA